MADKPTFKDIVEFAKAGWKPGDVKEIIEAASKLEVKEEEPAATTPKEEVQPEQENSQKETSEQPKEEDKASDDKVAELQKQIDDLNNKLKSAQEQNTKKNLQGTVQTDQEKLEDIARSFM